MSTISFDYNSWDQDNDVPLDRPGSQLGLAVINDEISGPGNNLRRVNPEKIPSL